MLLLTVAGHMTSSGDSDAIAEGFVGYDIRSLRVKAQNM